MESMPLALVMYDIMCQYGIHLMERVEKSPGLSIPDSLELHTGIRLFHIHGHQDSCLPQFSSSYIPGAKQVDGEIIETLWAPLNNISRSIQGDVPGTSPRGSGCTYEPFQLEEDGQNWLVH